jgi:pimeloyl-ACP methyl ester carboxylesterase
METTKSADGTVIAYDRAGQGPALVVCVGAFCDRHSFVPPESLTRHFTVYTYDRRGRGDSGDIEPYAPEREYEDLAAVAAAATAGRDERSYFFGHSSGAAIGLQAAAAGVPLAGLVAYEAPYGNEDAPRPPADPATRIGELVAAGRRGDAVRFWMVDVIGGPAEMLAQMESSPWWPRLEAMVHTVLQDIAVTGKEVPAGELAKINVPVLVVGGQNSPGWFQRTVRETAEAIPGARLSMLEGQDHGAPPEIIAAILTDFFGTE